MVEMDELNTKGVKLELEGYSLYEEGKKLESSSRTVGEMKEVLLSPEAASSDAAADKLYYMYRAPGVAKNPVFSDKKLRYDVTIMAPYSLGKEFNKTLGHYHPLAEKDLCYPELYEVIEGNATYLLQKRLPDSRYDVVLVKAREGDKVLMPPNYGHITINTGPGRLIMANLVSSEFSSDYNPIVLMKGGAVYLLTDGSVVVNKEYRRFSLSMLDRAPNFGIPMGEGSIYDLFLADPEKFDFLNKPSQLR